MNTATFPRYDRHQSYDWNYQHAPDPVDVEIPELPGSWDFCGLPVASPLGIPAGPLLNGKWCLYYASLGFDVLTYKTVRSGERACYPMPNLQPVRTGQLLGAERELPAVEELTGSWAVSYGMPSRDPSVWREDVAETRRRLPQGKLLVVSVVATVQPGWSIADLADDYARCAKWAVESGADAVETNFSCPNVTTCDGQLYQQPRDAQQVVQRVREAVGSAPYIVKIGHVPTREAAEVLLEAIGPGIQAIAMTNSVATKVRAGDRLLFDGQVRGICGEAIRTASVQQLSMFAELVRAAALPIQLIGVGGIRTAQQVRDYLTAGAAACHLATAAMIDPTVALHIRREW